MLDNVLIGQYIPGNSVIHRIHPSVKIVLMLVYITVLFMIHSPLAYMLYALSAAICVFICRIPVRAIIRGLKPIWLIILFTAVLNLFTTKGDVILSFFVFSITMQGMTACIFTTCRLVLLITVTSLLTLTTPPMELTYGIEKLLSPLKRFKFPAGEVAMMMTVAIRFIPTISEEADKIMKAQTARGADFSSGTIIHRAKALIPVIVPLLISSFRRADELSMAMDARCYRPGAQRTRMNEINVQKTDVFAIIIWVFLILFLLICEYIL